MNRGRPRHDDILTPREWEVLGLVREGLTNEEIADRLGVAHNTVKYHVSEILSKLGVESRQDAARWRGRPKVAFGLAPIVGLLQKLSTVSPLKLAGAGAIGAAGAGLVVLAIGVLMSNGSQELPSEPAVTVPVQWIEEELPPPVSWEAPAPFEDVVGPGEEDSWRAYLYEEGQRPELIVESPRYLYDAVWHDDEVIFKFTSRKQWSSGRLGVPIYGLAAYERGNLMPTWERITDEHQASLSEDGSRLLLTPRYGQLYFQSVGDNAMRLEGFVTEHGMLFAPQGDYFYVIGYEDEDLGLPEHHTYVLRPGDTTALKLDTRTGGGYFFPRWSPDGTKLAYPQGTDIVVVNVETGMLTHLPAAIPSGPPQLLGWSTDSKHITYAGGLYDAETGGALYPPNPDVAGAWSAAASATFFAIGIDEATSSNVCPRAGEAGQLPSIERLAIFQLSSLARPVLCLPGEYRYLEWLTDHLLLAYTECDANCPPDSMLSGPRAEWLVADLRDGESTHVWSGGAPDLSVPVSSNAHFAVTDDSLELHNVRAGSPGGIVFDQPLPASEEVRKVVLSSDGKRVVVITGPEVDLEALRLSSP